jgi:cysteine-rich repeat protein
MGGALRWVWAAAVSSLITGGLFAACGSDDGTVQTPTGTIGQGGGGGAGGAGGSLVGDCVIDGVVSGSEQCDDGNQVIGDGCDPDCSWTCTQGTTKGDGFCDDDDPCNGEETCSVEHTCEPGTPAADGVECGDGMICKDTVCGDDVCGDEFVSALEDCDDGNVIDGDGCDDCSFTCVSTDPNACEPDDPCEGQGVCDDSTHTCGAGTPLADDTPCGTDAYCKSGVCKAAVCPDGVEDVGEACDDGDLIDGNGCDNDCTLSCVVPATDCGSPPVCQLYQCDANDMCELVADPSQNGTTCGSGLECDDGACIAPGADCGNGILETGEDCDFGTGNNGPNAGCETNCTFSCTLSPDSCPDANPCNGVEACATMTFNGQTGQRCNAGTPLSDCTACSGGLCNGGTCSPSTCGDGCVDAGNNEDCEPPNTPTCSSTCTDIICGNGTREGGEQCDDSNTDNNDGCDSTCMFEQIHRANYLKMQWTTGSFCGTNALGEAMVGGTVRSELETGIDDSITDGSISLTMKMLGLDDLTGTSDPTLDIGVLNATPETALAPYDGDADLDWWYDPDATSLDAQGVPLAQLPGSIAAKVLTAGPGEVSLAIVIGGSPGSLDMSDVMLQIDLGATSTPVTSAGVPPGHVAAENLDPALVSYQTAGQHTANGAGLLCGKVSAASLAQIPAPADLVGGGLLSCWQGYTTQNSLLDVLVGGCTIFVTQIRATQPDTDDPNVGPVQDGPPYTLTTDGNNQVNGCRDANDNTVDLNACLADAAYSSYFKFASGRIIYK